jgi:3-deoxy-7-phosphoheptulonate synthase
MMVESFLCDGNQPFPKPVNQLKHGVSITDACIGWEMTERLLRDGHARLTTCEASTMAKA